MKIRMYNVGFGDCFCIRDRKKSLLVDFGTNNSRIEGRPRKEIFDLIISDLSTIEQKNLLLTHFHLDHLSGLLYMMKHRESAYDFGKIYLPDVFSRPEMSKTLVLLLFADLVKDSCLPSRQVSLFALVDALRQKPQKIELLSRGMEFDGKYQALWPDIDVIQNETEHILSDLEEQYKPAFDELLGFAENLRKIVYSMTENCISEEDMVRDKKYDVRLLDRKFRILRATEDFQQLLKRMDQKSEELRQLKYRISIVFHTARDGELNVLFTGDIQQDYLTLISDNYDGKASLHEHYWCIKVPYHGTHEHYFDFSKYAPENMMISNGIYFYNSKTQARELRTSAQYGGLFYINDTHMYCSNCDCCDAYLNGCSCKESDVISPRYYKDI